MDFRAIWIRDRNRYLWRKKYRYLPVTRSKALPLPGMVLLGSSLCGCYTLRHDGRLLMAPAAATKLNFPLVSVKVSLFSSLEVLAEEKICLRLAEHMLPATITCLHGTHSAELSLEKMETSSRSSRGGRLITKG